LSAITAPIRKKHLGLLKGKIKVTDDFNTTVDDEVLALFERALDVRVLLDTHLLR
jgi:hypothetical protein